MASSNRNTLDLVGDGDDVQVVQDAEFEFRIKILDTDAASLRTVGDLHDLVCANLRVSGAKTCIAARAYREILPALESADARIKPSTRLDALAAQSNPAGWVRCLNRRSSLDCDVTLDHWLVLATGVFLFVAPILATALSWGELGAGALIWLVGWIAIIPVTRVLSRLLPASIPRGIATLGDLVRRSLALNYRRLTADGAVGNRADIWLTVCAICRDASGHDGPINRDTTFFAMHAN